MKIIALVLLAITNQRDRQGHLPTAPAGSRDPLLAAAHQAFLAR